MSQTYIIGAYNTQFGNFVKKNKETGEITDTKTIYDLMIEAGKGAIADAGISADEIDAVWVGSCAPGLFANQEHLAAAAVEIAPESFRFKPMTRCEDACASGSVAIYNAVYAIESGRINTALVVGVEKMNLLDTKGVTHALATCSYWPEEGAKNINFPDLFAFYAKGYQKYYNIDDQTFRKMLASAAALCYRNGVENPLAHFGKGGPSDKLSLFTADAILNLPPEKNPTISDPLRLHDCSLITDGAAAVVITRKDLAMIKRERSVRIAGIGHVVERMPISVRPQMYRLDAAKFSVKKALEEAKLSYKDINIAEVHDCFTINQILCTEALGFSEDGKGGYDYLNGRFGPEDEVSINLSGGLKAKGHPVGATGVSMHALLYKQLIGEPIGVAPKKKPTVAATLNVGGSAVTNCVSILIKE